MNFLLNINGDVALWVALAISAILAICFYVYKHKSKSAEGRNTHSPGEPSVSNDTEVTTNDDEEIIAVIAAAIAAAEADSNGLKFKVVSFRRI